MTLIVILVIFTFLLIILTQNIGLRIISRGRLRIEISSVLFKLTLTDVKSRKRKKARMPPSALSGALKFLLKHSAITVSDISLSDRLHVAVRGAFTAFFSLLFAYCDSFADKIDLPKEAGTSSLPFAFDISVRSRLYIYISAFLIFKIKAYFKRGARAQNAR